MMTAEHLKGSILQLAVEGKLVNHIDDEGTSSELFNSIQHKKEQIIKETGEKKVKFKPIIDNGEIPFDIPEHWEWCRLGSLALVVTKGTTPRGGNVAYLESGIGFLRAENIAGLDRLDLSNLKYVDEETNQGYLSRSIIKENDILITIAGTLGRTGLVRKEDLPLNANQAISIVRLATPEDLNLRYLISVLNTPEIQKALTAQKKITAIPNLTLEIIANCLIPLPPLEEQKRIVAKIEELMPFVEKYAEASTKLNTLNTSFPDMMKKSILQEAVQGKLVPQDPNDEPASELLKRITEEKQSLIKEEKIKKQKALPAITEDEIPFDIPESWEWVRLGNLCRIVTGKLDANAQDANGDYPFFTCGEEVYKTITHAFDCDAILLGGNNAAGIYKMHRYCGKFDAYQRVYVISGRSKIEMDYLYCVVKYWLPSLRVNSQGTTTRFIKLGQVTDMLVPLPPLEEQQRIVKKISALIPMLALEKINNCKHDPVYYPEGLMDL